jgi:Skp family chaperone for outer membrane proteins
MKIIILWLLLALSLALPSTISLQSTDDSQLGALLAGDWYAQLPQKMQDARTNLLKLLKPDEGSATQAQHSLAIRSRHMLAVNMHPF